jgi:hypothetical protein
MSKSYLTFNELDFDTILSRVPIDQKPDECPVCHVHIRPDVLFCYVNQENRFVQVVYGCTRQECQTAFIVTYEKRFSRYDHNWSKTFFQVSQFPFELKQRGFDGIIQNLSPDFITIYHQASSAEQLGLKEICGGGYRKALEFLVKDYLIKYEEADETDTKSKFLGKCIKDLPNPKIKEMAERATWLGNDETHYVRKWGDKDVQDLKKLIEITVYWIMMEVSTKKYLEEMN